MTTPMLQQYNEIKEKAGDAIVFFRLGDFYEMFGNDAEIAAPLLEIVLTARDAGRGNKIPMCGVPYHSADGYINKLVSNGFKVAICEQIEDPQSAKGIVKREIIRTVSPGTIDTVGNDTKNNYLACVYRDKNWGLAYLDITTGDFMISEHFTISLVEAELSRLLPAELLFSQREVVSYKGFLGHYTSMIDPHWCKKTSELFAQFQGQDHLLIDFPTGIGAASGLWQYVLHNIPNIGQNHFLHIETAQNQTNMILDPWTRKNLELVTSLRSEEEKGTLFSVLNRTKTAFGARLLRNWIQQPFIQKQPIQDRLDTVEELYNNSFLREGLQKTLKNVYDLERLLGKLSLGKGNATDLLSLASTLSYLPPIRDCIMEQHSSKLVKYIKKLSQLDELSVDVLNAINPEAPHSLKEGNVIKAGYSEEIDSLRLISKGAKEWIVRLENRERERTKIKSLKIGYNKVFGYYIEITNANAHLIATDYQRKQTLSNVERFITPELKKIEEQILDAQDKLAELEYDLYLKIRERILSHSSEIMQAAQTLAEIDVFVSLAEVASHNHYCKPEIVEDGKIHIVDGRHPVVERLTDLFVPNDTLLTKDKHLSLITGPNMGGKSTYMRQVALIVLMAQMGSFVPAQKATLSIVDCLYTRIGASDSLVSGQSTFMVEMNEVSYILQNATSDSLILLDEVGRGTATYDGLSLAWAIAEFLIENPSLQSKTLFATHYHELTQLEVIHHEISNLHVAVKEQGEDIIFLHKILPGKADRSYGLHVAKIAGLPQTLIRNASIILTDLEKSSTNKKIQTMKETVYIQPSLFEQREMHPLLKELKELDMDNFTPRQALNYLYDFLNKIHSSEVL